MKKKLNVPIRFKIIVLFLSLITVVVGIITFTMANMFHADKTAYVHDLTSAIAINKAQETDALLSGYRERLLAFTRIMYEKELNQEQKSRLLSQLFQDFREFIAITLYGEDLEPVTVYDTNSLNDAGLSAADFTRFRKDHQLPMDKIREGEIFVENSTLSDRLPTLTLAASHQPSDSEKPAVITATIRLDSLLRVAGESKVFETFVVDSRGNLLAHSDPGRIFPLSKVNWIPEIDRLLNQQSLGITREYVQNGTQMVGGFARTRISGLLAGVQIQKTAAYLTARELMNNLIAASLVILVIAALLALFFSRRLTRPIERLSAASREVGKGQFDIRVERGSNDEIGDLSDSFNTMTSELDAREKALKDAQSALIQSEKMAAFGQLGAGIAHEIKNPLAGILGFAQLSLRKVDKDTPLHKNLLTIEKETKRCKTIIENLMKFARQEKVDYMQVNVNTIVEDSMAIVDHQLSLNKVTLEKKLAEDIPMITGNANQIQQVLMNLMLNSQQAMNGNPGIVRMETVFAGPEHIEIRVRDNGPGIPKEIQAKIFEPFYTTKPAGQGTGLGLSVSYGIVKDHGGIIRVDSQPGKGALFIITLPVNRKLDDIPRIKENDIQEKTDTGSEKSGEQNAK